MFAHLIPIFATACLAYALAFLLVLWLVEKPVLSILAYDHDVAPEEIRRVHQTESSYVTMNGPWLLAPGVIGAALATALQSWQSNWAIIPLSVALVTLFTTGFVLIRARAGSRAVVATETDAPVEEVAASLRRLISLHYRSLALIGAAFIGQIVWLIVSPVA